MRKTTLFTIVKSILFTCLWLMAFSMFAQNISVRGTVKDAQGEPLTGVTVLVQKTGNGTITDIDGKFALTQVAPNANLEVSYVGMKMQVIPVNGRTTIDVTLREDSELLDEVVVVGYGTQKKVNLTGTVNTVSSEAITGKSTTSLVNALQGTTPGVTVISRPGDLGNDMGSINVRGRGNLGTAAPLFIVDGIPVSEGDFQRIYPGDIESISILKDAAASAI